MQDDLRPVPSRTHIDPKLIEISLGSCGEVVGAVGDMLGNTTTNTAMEVQDIGGTSVCAGVFPEVGWDVLSKSWDRKSFRRLHADLNDDAQSDRIWAWISDRYVKKTGKDTMRCERKLEALSEVELLAAIRFLKSADELDLAIPLYQIAREEEVATESTPIEDGDVAFAVVADQPSSAVGFQLAGINKRGMPQSCARRKKR